jgi:hypothetical protein
VTPDDEWEWVRKARGLGVWALGESKYVKARDHLREQFVFAFWMLCWLAMLRAIGLVAGDHMLPVWQVTMSDALHALEDISLLVWFITFVAKAIRKEWRDHHD